MFSLSLAFHNESVSSELTVSYISMLYTTFTRSRLRNCLSFVQSNANHPSHFLSKSALLINKQPRNSLTNLIVFTQLVLLIVVLSDRDGIFRKES